MKTAFFLLLQSLLITAASAQMSNGQYTYFSGEWQAKFEVVDNGMMVSTFELTDLKSHKSKTGKGNWRNVFHAIKNDKEGSPTKGEEITFYEIVIDGEYFRLYAPRGGALLFEFPDGKKVGMKEKK